MREKSVLDEKLLKTIPLVNEANAIASELGKGMIFEPKLVRRGTAEHRTRTPECPRCCRGGGAHSQMANQDKISLTEYRALYGDEAAPPEQLDTEVYVKVEYEGADKSAPPVSATRGMRAAAMRAPLANGSSLTIVPGRSRCAGVLALQQVHEPAVHHAGDVPDVERGWAQLGGLRF